LELLFHAERSLLRVLEDQKEETRDAIRVGRKLCSLDHDWLCDSEKNTCIRPNSHFATTTATQPKADSQPTIATVTAVK
jgi:hypothetical protein